MKNKRNERERKTGDLELESRNRQTNIALQVANIRHNGRSDVAS